MDQRTSNEKLHKIDLYSIPVFLIELAALTGLAYVAYLLHFQYKPEPFISGFYCDDMSYRQSYDPTRYTGKFEQQYDMLTIISMLILVPIPIIIPCELVNSLFGSIKFRNIRALHSCCKLHSITRRTFRFSGAYLLGLFLLMISCDILAITTGRLRPYFAQDCRRAYDACFQTLEPSTASPIPSSRFRAIATNADNITSPSSSQSLPLVADSISAEPISSPRLDLSRQLLFERKWIDLSSKHLDEVCDYNASDPNAELKFRQLALSWPSYPAAIFTYSCLFVACYLSFVGTARPVRLITCCLVLLFAVVALVFDVQLVKEHYNHWEDVASAAVLAALMVLFVLYIYLNKFSDHHYYEQQKARSFIKGSQILDGSFGNYSAETTLGNYTMNDVSAGATNNALQTDEVSGPATNNDLAMRYFQIPRANYRGGPRPTSAMR